VAAVDAAEAGLRVRLDDGSELTVDLVLSAVGLRPRTQLAAAAGLAVDRGIRTDARLQTSDPAIWALGDCAEVEGAVRPFVLPLLAGARALAASLAGSPQALEPVPWPITVKTPVCPLVLLPPTVETAGEWQLDPAGDACFVDHQGRLQGFALAGEHCNQRESLLAGLGQAQPQAVGSADGGRV